MTYRHILSHILAFITSIIRRQQDPHSRPLIANLYVISWLLIWFSGKCVVVLSYCFPDSHSQRMRLYAIYRSINPIFFQSRRASVFEPNRIRSEVTGILDKMWSGHGKTYLGAPPAGIVSLLFPSCPEVVSCIKWVSRVGLVFWCFGVSIFWCRMCASSSKALDCQE